MLYTHFVPTIENIDNIIREAKKLTVAHVKTLGEEWQSEVYSIPHISGITISLGQYTIKPDVNSHTIISVVTVTLSPKSNRDIEETFFIPVSECVAILAKQ